MIRTLVTNRTSPDLVKRELISQERSKVEWPFMLTHAASHRMHRKLTRVGIFELDFIVLRSKILKMKWDLESFNRFFNILARVRFQSVKKLKIEVMYSPSLKHKHYLSCVDLRTVCFEADQVRVLTR